MQLLHKAPLPPQQCDFDLTKRIFDHQPFGVVRDLKRLISKSLFSQIEVALYWWETGLSLLHTLLPVN